MSDNEDKTNPNVIELVEKFQERKFKPKLPTKDPKQSSTKITFPLIDMELKEKIILGLCGIYNGEFVVLNRKYKVQRIRDNGSVILKPLGKFRG